jgi:transposase-like protein
MTTAVRGAFRSRDLLDGVLAGARLARPAVSDAHEGLKAAAARVLDATWQRCRVHFMRNILTHADTTRPDSFALTGNILALWS